MPEPEITISAKILELKVEYISALRVTFDVLTEIFADAGSLSLQDSRLIVLETMAHQQSGNASLFGFDLLGQKASQAKQALDRSPRDNASLLIIMALWQQELLNCIQN